MENLLKMNGSSWSLYKRQKNCKRYIQKFSIQDVMKLFQAKVLFFRVAVLTKEWGGEVTLEQRTVFSQSMVQ